MTSSSSSTYKDCSGEICSIYCPERCFLFPTHPPPPSFELDDDYDSGGPDFSPLIIALIGILASAFILICYYTIISRFCGRRSHRSSWDESTEMTNEDLQAGSSTTPGGLDEALIKSITVCCRYKKGDQLVEGKECSVCLSEFEDDESLRLLPKCNHAFHLPCIDTWFKSHSSCPLCRADIAAAPSSKSNHLASSALDHITRSDVVLVIQDQHIVDHQTVVGVGQELDGPAPENAPKMPEDARLSIADILRIDDDEEEEGLDHLH